MPERATSSPAGSRTGTASSSTTGSTDGTTSDHAGDLTPRAAWELLRDDEGALLVDVRTAAEWRYVGVPDTEALGRAAAFVEWVDVDGRPNERFLDDLAGAGLRPGDGRPVVFLCRSGVRSLGAARAATRAGLGPAYNVLEGFEGDLDPAGHRGHRGWRAAGLPWRQS